MILRPIVCRSFIARDEELVYLQERRREAAAGHGGLVLVSGEAGVGKSRLLAEFRAAVLPTRTRVGLGSCHEFVQRPYGPILDVLARFDAAAALIEPAVSKREQFDAITGALLRESARTTVVGIIEDLHWADSATLDILAYLTPKLSSSRMLLVASYRAGEPSPDDPLTDRLIKLAGTSGTGRVALTPLQGPELRNFIDDALAGIELPNETKRDVARASEGNPFFVEELLRSAVERGSPSTVARGLLPTTLRAALLERLRPLVPEQRRILAQAAVIGRRFELRLLAETLDVSVEALLPALRRARDIQLVEEETETVFRFRHALTREAIYADFLAAEVRPLHRKIALVIEALPPESRSVESLAYHWWAAGDNAKSAHFNELAGDAAGSVYAHDDAVAAYERALESLDALPAERARVLEKLARRRVITGFNDRALSAYAEAADLFRGVGHYEREAECRVSAGVQAYRLGGTDPTAPLLAMLERLAPDERRALSRLHLGMAHISSLRYRTGAANAHLDLVARDVIDADPDLRYSYHATRAMVTYIDGDVDGFRRQIAEWLAASHDASDSGLTPLVHFNGGMYLSILGRHDEAMSHFASALAIAHERLDRMAETAARAMSAMALFAIGDLAGVRTAVDAVRALPTDSEVAMWHGAAWGTLAALYLDDERLITEWFDELETRISSPGAVIYAAGYAEIMCRRGRRADARALLHRAIDYGDRPRGMYMTLFAVAKFGDEADFPRARTNLVRGAEATAEVVEQPAIALFDAYVALRHGDRAAAASHAASSIDAFERLGYPLLEAAARELAGDRDGALRLYRQSGALRDIRRLTGLGEIGESTASNGRMTEKRPDQISSREYEIARLVALGKSNVDIGRTLSISHKTVEKHLGSIYQKLGFSSRSQLAAYVATVTPDA